VVPESIKRQRGQKPADDPSNFLGLGAPEVLEAAGPPSLNPGSWVEYKIRSRGQASRVRLSVLPPPKDAPEDRRWLEVVGVGTETLPSVVKILIRQSPQKLGDIERMVLYPAGQAPLELPVDEAQQAPPAEPGKSAPTAKVRKLGPTDVKVAAGTFRAERLRVSATGGKTELWLSRGQVPLWGLVRSEGADRTIELLHFGTTGAHTVVPPAPGEPDERPDAGPLELPLGEGQ
jgi:hypothetical protein